MKSHHLFPCVVLTVAAGALLSGCLFKPTTVTTRSYVLTPLAATATNGATAASPLAIGIGLVKMPGYLLRSSMVVRKGANEIDYMEDALWAERLDHSFQQTLAANLSTLLNTDEIRLSAWERGEVALVVYVTVEQFDVDAQGRGTLTAWWRVERPGEDRPVKSGEANLSRNGQSPFSNPQAAATTLSELTAEFSQVVAKAIRESAASGAGGK